MEVFVVCELGIAMLILAFTQLRLSALEEPAKTRGPGGRFFLAAIERAGASDRRFARDNFLLKILRLLCRKLEERH